METFDAGVAVHRRCVDFGWGKIVKKLNGEWSIIEWAMAKIMLGNQY